MTAETFQGPHGRYWLSTDAGRHWTEVDRDAYLAAERAAGFSAPEGQEATAAFGNGTLRGTTLDPHRDQQSDHRRWVLQEIARDAEADVYRFEGAPFTGRTVAEYLGGQAALIVALAKVVESLLPADSSAEPPDGTGSGADPMDSRPHGAARAMEGATRMSDTEVLEREPAETETEAPAENEAEETDGGE